MQTEKFIHYIESGNIHFFNIKEILKRIDLSLLTHQAINKILHYSLINDNYILLTKALWPLIEDEKGLIKYNLYCHLLEHTTFNENTARYICLKERYFKVLNTSLLGKCGTVKAVNFLINAYSIDINNIINAIASCSCEEQIPIVKHLLSRLNDNQKNLAVNKFMIGFMDNYHKDLSLLAFIIRQKDTWSNEIMEHEQIKKVLLFNRIDQKLTGKIAMDKTNKI